MVAPVIVKVLSLTFFTVGHKCVKLYSEPTHDGLTDCGTIIAPHSQTSLWQQTPPALWWPEHGHRGQGVQKTIKV